MRTSLLAVLLCITLPIATHAQEQKPPPLIQKSRVNPEALAALDNLMASYAALNSYSDTCEVKLQKAEEWPKDQRDRMTFAGKLAFERPGKLRFEGQTPNGTFVLFNDGTTTRILNPEHKDKWVQRPQSSPLNLSADFSRSNLKLREGQPVPIDSGWTDVGPTMVDVGLMFHPEAWQNDRDQVVTAQFQADETTGGEACYVLKLEHDYGTGEPISSRLWIAKSDGLLRRFERNFGEGKDAPVMIETHSDIQLNTALPSTTWSFTPPTGVPPSPQFPPTYPIESQVKLKIGDPLPVFSQDGINGEAVELNPKSGGVTVVYFFFSNIAASDGASLQRLQTALGAQGLQVVAAPGDADRKRVQALITKNKLSFPVYCDDKAFRNQLAKTLQVSGWPLVLLFDREAKLRAIAQRPGDAEFVQALRQQFPDVPEQTITDALIGPSQDSR